MRYVSTRGGAGTRGFSEVLLGGLAPDGGLYAPLIWPHFSLPDWRAMRRLDYPALAARILQPFIGEAVPFATLEAICRDTYRVFRHPATVPLIQLGPRLFLAELFHGPTYAFKDMALQWLGRIFDYVLASRSERLLLIGATSGDTGSAAIAAAQGRERLGIVILHPAGRTSEIQRRQMTTVSAPNVLNLAVEGTFDDCQDLVKALFHDPALRHLPLGAVNSINWARIAAQIPYYVATALALGAPEREVAFSVPTGNFGNVFAAYAARRLGLPIVRLIVASNANDILARFFTANDMSLRPVVPTVAPSMDIQVSSNFERLLFELLDRDAAATAAIIQRFRETGRMEVPEAAWARARRLFHGFRLDDEGALAEIRKLHEETGYIADPHSAIGVAAARAEAPAGVPVIAMATAHPAKFGEAIAKALGAAPPLPKPLADLYEKEERFRTVPPRLDEVRAEILAFAEKNRWS
jgi:threonine synthase